MDAKEYRGLLQKTQIRQHWLPSTMQIHGDLIDTHVIVKKSKDVGRLFTKSRIGTPLPQNTLQLSLLEAAFLSDEKKIVLHSPQEAIHFKDLVSKAALIYENFDVLFLVYRDLRKRGHCVQEHLGKTDASLMIKEQPSKKQPRIYIKIFSERDFFDIKKISALLEKMHSLSSILWFAIVDEEGDITYYTVTQPELAGANKEYTHEKVKGLILGHRVLLFDEQVSDQLFSREFYGKPFGSGLQLSLVEALYLVQKKILTAYKTSSRKPLSAPSFRTYCTDIQPDILQRLQVYRLLKQNGLLVKTGFKFGTHFRGYTQHPDEYHAEYLIHAVPADFRRMWAEMSRAVRLAHAVNKDIVFASVHDDPHTLTFVSLGRLRP